jgi:hypothetical protein
MVSPASQADSAGSIPVIRSQRLFLIKSRIRERRGTVRAQQVSGWFGQIPLSGRTLVEESCQ